MKGDEKNEGDAEVKEEKKVKEATPEEEAAWKHASEELLESRKLETKNVL